MSPFSDAAMPQSESDMDEDSPERPASSRKAKSDGSVSAQSDADNDEESPVKPANAFEMNFRKSTAADSDSDMDDVSPVASGSPLKSQGASESPSRQAALDDSDLDMDENSSPIRPASAPKSDATSKSRSREILVADSDDDMDEDTPERRESLRKVRMRKSLLAQAAEDADSEPSADEAGRAKQRPKRKSKAVRYAEQMAMAKAAEQLARERAARDSARVPVKISTEPLVVTPEALDDSDNELWLVRVPHHDTLVGKLLGKEIVVPDEGESGVQFSPMMGQYGFNVTPIEHEKGAVWPSGEALPTAAFVRTDGEEGPRLEFGRQFERFVTVEFRATIERKEAPPPARVYPKVPEGLRSQFPLPGKAWRTQIGNIEAEMARNELNSARDKADVRSGDADKLGCDVRHADRDAKLNVSQAAKGPPVNEEAPEEPGTGQNDEITGDKRDLNAKAVDKTKNPVVPSSKVREVGSAEAVELNTSEPHEKIGKEKIEATVQNTRKSVNGVSREKSKQSGKAEKKQRRKKKRKSERDEIQPNSERPNHVQGDLKKEDVEIEKGDGKKEPVLADQTSSVKHETQVAKMKKRRRSEDGAAASGTAKSKKKKKKRKLR